MPDKQPLFNYKFTIGFLNKRIPEKIFAKKQAILYLINLSFQFKSYSSLLQQALIRSSNISLVYCQSTFE